MAEDHTYNELYGSDGAVPSPSWSSRWSGLEIQDLEGCFEVAAESAALSLNQMEQLLQGLPPEVSCWPHTRSYLSANRAAIRELRFALASGVLVHPVSPSQFVAWCEAHPHELPDLFVDRVRAMGVAAVVQPISNPLGALWGQLVASKPTTTSGYSKPVQGRPKTAEVRDAKLIKAATEMLLAAATAGVAMTRNEVAVALEGTSLAGGIAIDTIKRVLAKRLPLQYAKEVARQARASAAQG